MKNKKTLTKCHLRVECTWLVLLVVLASFCFEIVDCAAGRKLESVDDDFAEFEQFDAEHDLSDGLKAPTGWHEESETIIINADKESAQTLNIKSKVADIVSDEEEYGVVEDDSDDFATFSDNHEFHEEFSDKDHDTISKSPHPASTLKVVDIPAHLRHWQDYSSELIIICCLAIYVVNYAYGRSKNLSMATAWLESNRDLLAEKFTVVGDDGLSQEVTHNVLIRESDSSYCVWCSGRQGLIGMLVQIKLLKRQDLFSVLVNFFKPKNDTISIKVTLNADEMDPIVFAVGQRKSLSKMAIEASDLSHYCTEKNAEKFGLPFDYAIYAELGEFTSGILDAKLVSVLCKYSKEVDFIHISDQYVSSKTTDTGGAVSKLPVTSKMIIFNLNIKGKLNATEKDVLALDPLLPVAIYVSDRARRFRLSREAKLKAERNRQRVQESFLKTTHAQRQEAAQQRREERARERREQLMAEEDPEKQRRLEKQEMKRQMRKMQPRMKQLKIKAY